MKEYIERAMAFAVLVDFPGELSPENIGLAVARKAIDALPAADVAEVVRCKDCQYYQDAKTNKKGFLICPAFSPTPNTSCGKILKSPCFPSP